MNTPKGIPNPKTKYTKIFGSVEPILELETFEEVSRSSDNVYGLSAGVITKNIKITLEYATAIEVGEPVQCHDCTNTSRWFQTVRQDANWERKGWTMPTFQPKLF
ncbi:retinaldehyde dehydrogenase 3-like isoform X3 [Neodiprion pinetum]|uniref:retinaldehyde dehydrogenase 3-like isoform X3 n=1 Tax=Neodiprion pinetum TaxID=441929 RepID=UPI00371BCEB7